MIDNTLPNKPTNQPAAPIPSVERGVIPPPMPKTKPGRRREGWRSVLSTIAVLLIAPLFAVFLTIFVFQSYQVDGPSMETTLQHNDRLIVWKIPRTWARITGNPYIPKRGDIIVFTESRLGEFGQSPGKQLIKRVVALPGERVIIKDGVLKVYNDAYPKGFSPDKTLPYGSAIGVTPGELNTTVDKGQVFVVGDNRNNSLDSRTFGPIDANNIVGKLTARILPLNNFEKF